MIIFISSYFVDDPLCVEMYQFAVNVQHKPLALVMVGTDRAWQQDRKFGAELATQVTKYLLIFCSLFSRRSIYTTPR